MNYNKILIHPLGKEEDVVGIIKEVVENCEGYFATKKLLGMLYFEAQFENDNKAKECMDALEEIDEVSHTEWVENG
jgi:hypothetical protein